MSEETSLVRDAIEFLEFARQGTIAEAANVPDESWTFRPHPNARSFEEIVRHMIGAATMLVGEATDPEGDFQRRSPPEHVRAHGGELREEMTPAELREALADSLDGLVTRIREASEELLREPIRRFDGGTWSRLTYIFYAAAHEDHHCGQLAIYARSMGLIPALTQRIHGDAAK